MATFGQPGDLNHVRSDRRTHGCTVRGVGAHLCENMRMKRGERWSATRKDDDGHPGSEGGPLRRRRALRHLDSLALDPGREPNPATATAHVRVIGEADGPDGRPRLVPRAGRRAHEGAPPVKDEDGVEEVHAARARVQAVPIDQPLGVKPNS